MEKKKGRAGQGRGGGGSARQAAVRWPGPVWGLRARARGYVGSGGCGGVVVFSSRAGGLVARGGLVVARV